MGKAAGIEISSASASGPASSSRTEVLGSSLRREATTAPALAAAKGWKDLVTPGVVSGALFAFITSFDEVVVVLFIAGPAQTTIPIQMWSGIREEISPTILAVATLLVLVSILLLTTLELIRRRNERLRGLTPS